MKTLISFPKEQMCLRSEKIFHLRDFKYPSSPRLTKVLLGPIMRPELISEKHQTNHRMRHNLSSALAAKSNKKMNTFPIGKTVRAEVMGQWWESGGKRKDIDKIQIRTYISFSTRWASVIRVCHSGGLTSVPYDPTHLWGFRGWDNFPAQGVSSGKAEVLWIRAVHRGKQPLLSGKWGQYKQFTCDPHIQIVIPQNEAPGDTHSPSACPGQASGARSLALHPQSPGSPALSFWLLCSHSRSWEWIVNLGPRLQLRMYLEGIWWMRQLNNMSWPGTACYKWLIYNPGGHAQLCGGTVCILALYSILC